MRTQHEVEDKMMGVDQALSSYNQGIFDALQWVLGEADELDAEEDEDDGA